MALEPHDRDPGGAQIVLERRFADRTRGADNALEARGIQPHCEGDGHLLASAADVGVVQKGDDTESLRALAPAH